VKKFKKASLRNKLTIFWEEFVPILMEIHLLLLELTPFIHFRKMSSRSGVKIKKSKNKKDLSIKLSFVWKIKYLFPQALILASASGKPKILTLINKS
jgi:hypothetical protein